MPRRKLPCNKPRRAPAGSPKKYVVRACQSGKSRTIRFGQRGYQDYLQHKNPKRRKKFKKRHRCAEKKNKLTAGWWACNYNW